MVRLVDDDQLALWQEIAARDGVEEQQRVVDDDHLCGACAVAHTAHIACVEMRASVPRALVGVGGEPSAQAPREWLVEQIQVAIPTVAAIDETLHRGEGAVGGQVLDCDLPRSAVPDTGSCPCL